MKVVAYVLSRFWEACLCCVHPRTVGVEIPVLGLNVKSREDELEKGISRLYTPMLTQCRCAKPDRLAVAGWLATRWLNFPTGVDGRRPGRIDRAAFHPPAA